MFLSSTLNKLIIIIIIIVIIIIIIVIIIIKRDQDGFHQLSKAVSVIILDLEGMVVFP